MAKIELGRKWRDFSYATDFVRTDVSLFENLEPSLFWVNDRKIDEAKHPATAPTGLKLNSRQRGDTSDTNYLQNAVH